MAADPKTQKFGTMNSVFENVTIVEYRWFPLYRCATIYSDPELIKSGLKSDKNKSFYTKIRVDPN